MARYGYRHTLFCQEYLFHMLAFFCVFLYITAINWACDLCKLSFVPNLIFNLSSATTWYGGISGHRPWLSLQIMCCWCSIVWAFKISATAPLNMSLPKVVAIFLGGKLGQQYLLYIFKMTSIGLVQQSCHTFLFLIALANLQLMRVLGWIVKFSADNWWVHSINLEPCVDGLIW